MRINIKNYLFLKNLRETLTLAEATDTCILDLIEKEIIQLRKQKGCTKKARKYLQHIQFLVLDELKGFKINFKEVILAIFSIT